MAQEGDVALDCPENTWNDVESAWSDLPLRPWSDRRREIDWIVGDGYSWLCEDPEDPWNNAWEDYPQENPVLLRNFRLHRRLGIGYRLPAATNR
jgi:hypothetical protein